jgi:hypothetical protein
MRGILMLFTFAASLLFASVANTQAVSVTLAWTPSSSPNVAGYYIYYGTSSDNLNGIVPVSNNATNVTINGLTQGVTYYFAAASYDSNFDQSPLSPEISAVAGSTGSVAATLTSAVSSSAGQFHFTISGATGSQYVVQASTDLVHWVAIATNIAPFNFIDSNASQFKQRFYRAAYTSSE